MPAPRRGQGSTLAGLDKSRAYYMLDATVCLDIVNGATGGPFGEFFEGAGGPRASFLIPPPVRDELGGRRPRGAGRGGQMALVEGYLRRYGRCESGYRYPAEGSLREQTRAVRAAHPELSGRDAYLLYVFRRHCLHAQLRLLTSDAALRRAGMQECRCAVIDPRRFKAPSKRAQSGRPA